jgi:hypothetical protein
MIVKAGLLVDFGNSGTRVFVTSGNNAFRYDMSNKFAELPAGYKVPAKYANEKSTIFEYKGSYFANGLIVEREFTGKEMRPNALQSKTDQLVTDLTLSLAFIKAMSILGLAYNVAPPSLDVSFNVSVLLPPLDQERDESKMLSKISELSVVKTLLPVSMECKFKIGDSVSVHGEAVAAFFGAFYKEEGLKVLPVNEGKSLLKGDVIVRDNGQHVSLVEVEGNKKFTQGYTLVLDIGAGTTDVALFLDMELVDMSKETFKRGGNNVESIVRNELKKKFGFTPPSMQRVIASGILNEGVDSHDVSEIVTLAKEVYSRQTKEDIVQYLEFINIDMPVIKGLLVAGGGSLASKRWVDAEGTEYAEDELKDGVVYTEKIVSPAMAEVLINYLKELAPRMEPLDTEGKDLRALNIEGLLYLHKYV